MRTPCLALILFTTLLLSAIATHAMAQTLTADSLIHRLSSNPNISSSFELGHFDIHSHTIATSHCQKQGILGRLIPHLLPFQTNPSQDVVLEAFSHVNYQWPGDMHLNTVSLRTNRQQRKGRQIMRELYQALLPIYAMHRYGDDGSSKSYTLPFYDEGPRRYHFKYQPITPDLLAAAIRSGLEVDTTHLCSIHFRPRHLHHTMLTGELLVDSVALQVLAVRSKGRIDMGKFDNDIIFAPDSLSQGKYMPRDSRISIHYRYLNTRSDNDYFTRYKYITSTPFDSLQTDDLPHDLTPYYHDEGMQELDFEQLRPQLLPLAIDAQLNMPDTTTVIRPQRRKRRIETFSETLVDGSRLGPDDNRMRIYGPLDPASVGYNTFNGLYIRERARWQYRYGNNSLLHLYGEIGYAFKLREMRWRFLTEWTYRPQSRSCLRLEISRSNSTFSSKFINTVNEALTTKPGSIKFDSLGIDYYRHHEVSIQHSSEVANGLMLHVGIQGSYRDPVTHGVRRINEQHRQELLDSHYADFAPFIRLEYTPGQYYWYNQGYKQYIQSPTPTICLEFSRALPRILGADSNYGRVELDMQQAYRLSRTRTLAYHFGMGKFFNQRGEYFINYRYFDGSNYPGSWEDDRIGGAFHLLDDVWYSSSPSYIQTHYMYETPFGLLHQIAPLSPFVIKERFYHGILWGEGKQLYNEFGYGLTNNYFNVGFFIGFKDLRYNGIGFKFRIEIGDHI